MIGVLVRKLTGLGRDENGAALMVTLALFLLMYLSGAGVFAIGKVVKDRVHLQNACDAAAYSAAVVQADTLSRIATINRAMAWTYVSMTRRQMDYIVYKWLEETCEHHKEDEDKAKFFAEKNQCSLPDHWGITVITLNGDENKKYTRDDLQDEYKDNLPISMSACGDSFYSQETTLGGLGAQIDDDLATLQAMNSSVSNLANGLPGRVFTVVTNVLSANIPGAQTSGESYVFKIIQNSNPAADRENGSGSGYLMDIRNTAADELRFIRFYTNAVSVAELFGTGIDDWFERNDAGMPGIRRSYNYGKSGALYAEWEWWSSKRFCSEPNHSHEWANESECTHKHDSNRCFCLNDNDWETSHHIKATCHADNNSSWDNRFASMLNGGEEVYARPLVLRDSYFGEAGTITVGLAKYNENPWYRILKTGTDTAGILRGIFAAFNPYRFVEWTWAFSSAKAGYKKSGDEKREYRIHGDTGGAWNLCVDDWDAVFVPVRRAVSMAETDGDDGEWDYSNTPPLREWVENGQWQPLTGASVTYNVSNMPDLPLMDTRYGADGNLDWDKIAEMLYH
ncbi:MAG: hypothetical protein E7046_00275 [Lentisphaerae bacterium]|nr:hypothetical protein [Lentisphaerota bacterium]